MSYEQPIAPEIYNADRLQALYATDLLDTEPEKAFDRYTFLATSLLNAPISLITLIDKDRQYFKSTRGLDEPLQDIRETPLSYSLCQHVVSSEEPLIVEDATRHPTLCKNLAVRELGITSYIGFPIFTPDHYAIGSICVIDTVSHRWTEADQERLGALAVLVMTEINLRHQLHKKEEMIEQSSRQAQDLALANKNLQDALLNDKKLTEERNTAIDASRLKSEFLATVSHEIRTPLNGIIGMASLLSYTDLTGEQEEYVDIIQESGDVLLSIISNILDLSKIEADRIELESQPFEVLSVITGVIDLFTPQAAEKGITISHKIAPDVPETVVGDVLRLRQVLLNLVGNAVKFTPSGSVEVTVALIQQEGGTVRIAFEVQDTGIGISPDKVNQLFEPFSQLDSSTTRKYGGTGLGLAICKRLTELMGGFIRMHSEPGQGSTFVVEIAFKEG